MALSKTKKGEILNELVKKFTTAKSIGFASTQRLKVDEFFALRKELRNVGSTYTIAKKTLIKKAIKEALNIEIDIENIPGQIGVVCSNNDPMAGLGKVNDLVKETKGEKITWSLSIFDGKIKDLQETKIIAGLPSKEILLSRFVGSLQAPIANLARFFHAASKKIEETGNTKVSELKGLSKSSVKEEETEKTENK